ncbi:MAG TPA: hypothetical protein VE871_04740 [Longimicrobium sp.]|nr:hypothetical protein [Longimicrobium sp.]
MTGDTTDVLMFGGAVTELPLAALADALRRAGIPAEVRESSLFTGGGYIRAGTASGVNCSFEHIEPTEYLVRGDADRLVELESYARALSAALTRAGVRHRLEVYGEDESLAVYLHHAWPQNVAD